MRLPSWQNNKKTLSLILGGILLLGVAGAGLLYWPDETIDVESSRRTNPADDPGWPAVIRVDPEQQVILNIQTAEVRIGKVSAVLNAPGQVVPNESQYTYITPRARGVVRSVSAQIGQIVQRGELLAQIDSSEVAQARLNLIGSLQRLEIARAKANWQDSIYDNSLNLIAALQQGKAPDEIQSQFAERPVGRTREELLTAYAQYYLSKIASERYQNLQQKEAVSVALYQQKQAQYQVDLATYQGLIDRMAYEVTLDYTQARQELREARTAVKVARETLRVLGVAVDEIVRKFESGELTGHTHERAPKQTLREAADAAISPSRDVSELMEPIGEPVSTYELRAPFDGTILERERIVPGVVVDGQNHLFTIANLSTVWLEAHVHESDFDLLVKSKGGLVEFTSPAYPGRTFHGRVLYTGDIVEQKSRTVRLLATAENPDRMLKPGMFVTIQIHAEDAKQLPEIPEDALLTDNSTHFVFVQVGPERFERRNVKVAHREEGVAAISNGLKPGEQVVIHGAFELKSKSQAAEFGDAAT